MKKNFPIKKYLLLLISVIGLHVVKAQPYEFTSIGQTLTEDFNEMTFESYSLPSSWVAYHIDASQTPSETTQTELELSSDNFSNSFSSNGEVYNAGYSDDTDRSVALFVSNNVQTVQFAIKLTNDTGGEIYGMDLSYILKAWREQGNATGGSTGNPKFDFEYKVAPTSITDTDFIDIENMGQADIVGAFADDGSNANGGVLLDGNDPNNQLSKTFSMTDLGWSDGQELWLRWTYLRTNGQNAALAVDDISVTIFAEPAYTAVGYHKASAGTNLTIPVTTEISSASQNDWSGDDFIAWYDFDVANGTATDIAADTAVTFGVYTSDATDTGGGEVRDYDTQNYSNSDIIGQMSALRTNGGPRSKRREGAWQRYSLNFTEAGTFYFVARIATDGFRVNGIDFTVEVYDPEDLSLVDDIAINLTDQTKESLTASEGGVVYGKNIEVLGGGNGVGEVSNPTTWIKATDGIVIPEAGIYVVEVDNPGSVNGYFGSFTFSENAPTAAIAYDAGTWSNGTGPTSTDDVAIVGDYTGAGFSCENLSIDGSATLTVSSGVLDIHGNVNNLGSMIIESGASLITLASNANADFDDNIWDGNAPTIKRNRSVVAGRYSMVGSPVIGATGPDLGSSFIYSFDEASDTYLDATGADLVPGQGYASAADQAMSFTGAPNTGDITYSATDDGSGYNLVANPYAAAIEDGDFFTANTTVDAIYLWDDGGSETGSATSDNFITVNTSGMDTQGTPGNSASTYSGFIGSAQGFFVLVTSASTITFTEAMRDNGNNADANYFRKVEQEVPEHIKLILSSTSGLQKVTTVGWADDANDFGINTYYDSKIFNPEADLALYTVKANEKLAIQGVTETHSKIQLGVNLPQSGTYTITQFNEKFPSRSFYLVDNQTGVVTDLSANSYTFTGNAGELTNRFTLSTNLLAILAVEGPDLLDVYVSDNVLYYTGDEESNLQIITLSGKLMRDFKVSAKSKLDLSGIVPSGIYVLSNGRHTSKFIIK